MRSALKLSSSSFFWRARCSSSAFCLSFSTSATLAASAASAAWLMEGSAAILRGLLSSSAAAATEGLSASLGSASFTSRGFSFVVIETQPLSGPDPVSLVYRSLFPFRSSSRTKAPVESLPSFAAEPKALETRTVMPSVSAPPTTFQVWAISAVPRFAQPASPALFPAPPPPPPPTRRRCRASRTRSGSDRSSCAARSGTPLGS
mmetsp:Transcript_138074/g.344744  ORF Transcript_138074/g.344744 Transcript_138074/m.344744 type:complete len:204 (-) Transcript_138074:381-992(-)